MIIKKNALERGKNTGNITLRKELTNKNGIHVDRMPKDAIRHVRMLLIEKNLGIDEILDKYKEIIDMKLPGTRVGDVLKVLENIQKIHLHDTSMLDMLEQALNMKNEEEVVEYTEITLKKTEVLLQKIKAKKLNTKLDNHS